jgi:hypothetical protein
VPRHVVWLVTWIVAQLVVDYSASRRLVVDFSTSRWLVVDYFASAARPGASARRAARHADRRAACRRLLRLHRVSGCLGTSRGSSLIVDYSASRRLVARLVSPFVVDYFTYAACGGASARRAARHTARRRLLRAQRLHLAATLARRRLLRAPRLRPAATLALLQPRRVLQQLVSRQHWLYINYAARRRDVVFWSHRVDHSS